MLYPKPPRRDRRKEVLAHRNAVKDYVRGRDSYTCVNCGAGPTNEVHHIDSLGSGGRDEPENMVVLCHVCHILAQENRMTGEQVQALRDWAREASARKVCQLERRPGWRPEGS